MWAGELFGLSDEVGFPALPGDPGVVVAGTEVVVGGVGIGEQMPDDGEDGVAHSDDGAAFAAAPGDALVALGQECGGTCRPETISPRVAPKPWVVFAGRCAPLLARRALVRGQIRVGGVSI